jgi:myo-inositol-1(or 4)-monophosphatase
MGGAAQGLPLPEAAFPGDAGPVCVAAQAAADAAGQILRQYFRSTIPADLKSDNSPVTVADREAEHVMRGILGAYFPDWPIVGEEFGGHAPGAGFCWVLDPIDGTRAFITGRPTFGTLIALLHDGRPVLGVIDQPITGERWFGVAGAVTRFSGSLNGSVGARDCGTLQRAELSCTSPEMLEGERPRWQRLADRVRRVSWGGDCYAYGLLALGQIDLVAERDMKLWDFAALVPIVEGAGGRMSDWAGRRLSAGGDGTVLAAGSAAVHEAAVSALSM